MIVDAPKNDGVSVKILVSVSKRNHKKAVTRNLLKRRIREAYRLNRLKIELPANKQIIIAFIYTQKTILDYAAIENGVKKGITSINESSIKEIGDSTASAAN